MARIPFVSSVLVLALFSSAAAAANWVQVGPTPPGDYTLYYDSTSVLHDRSQDTALLVTLANFPSAQSNSQLGGGAPYYSTTDTTVFDCRSHEIMRIGNFAYFASTWAGGATVASLQGFDNTVRPVHDGTANDAMYQVACNY